MKIFKLELRMNRKVFLFWMLGMFFLVFAGVTKYSGFGGQGGAEVSALLDKFPTILLAVLGMSKVDLTSLGGYYTVLIFYVFICISLYAINLGNQDVTREKEDKTFEFLFSKPISRKKILLIKMLKSILFIFLFSLANTVYSLLAIQTLNFSENITKEIFLYQLVIFLIGLLFYSLALFIAVFIKNTETASRLAHLLFLLTFFVNVYCLTREERIFLWIFAPFQYFLPKELILGQLDGVLSVMIVLCSVILIGISIGKFDKKELLLN